MNRYLKELLIILIVIALFIFGRSLYTTWKDNRLEEQTTLRVESEMRFKQLELELNLLKLTRDSILLVNDNLGKIIEIQNKNPRIIIRKVYEKHNAINNLSDDSSVILFTSNAKKYSSLRGFYSLSRFSK